MRIVYLVRHGKAVEQNGDMPDFDRVMNDKGIAGVRAMAELCAYHAITPSLILTSPAPRALETARLFAEETGYPKKTIRTRKSMYDQAAGALLDELVSLDDCFGDVMLVGHNPSIEEFARFLTGSKKIDVPVGGFAAIVCDTGTWRDSTEGCGKLLFLEAPGGTVKKISMKAARMVIETKIARLVGEMLAVVDSAAAEKTVKYIERSSRDIAGHFLKRHKKNVAGGNEKKKSEV